MKPELTITRSAAGASSADVSRERLAKILDEYLQALERGESIEPEELFARHADIESQLRGYLSGLALFHQAAAPATAISGGLERGTRLGDFRLLREIGRGGMGVVYEAEQLSLGRRVAVKLLPVSSAINEKQIARFKHEAQAAAQIDHPHIVPVFAIGQEQVIHYFAMQLISGQSLSELIADLRQETSTAKNVDLKSQAGETRDHILAVARMGVQAAEALDAAHEIGVVHRDVKPSNLLLDEKGKLWVTDFGVARCKSGGGLTETGFVVGSLPYMSPEQALGQPALVDHRTDIYSLGITLYELATLRHPCEGPHHAETAVEFNRGQWLKPRAWNRAIPVDFENILLKAMAESRDERYATARDLADDLQRFLEGKPIRARRPSLGSRLEKWARRHQRTVAAGIAASLLVMVGAMIGLVMIASERAAKEAAYQAARQQSIRAEQSQLRAEHKFRQAHEVLERFSVRVNEMLASNVPGAEAVRRDLLAEMLPYYRQFAKEAADDASLQADLALTHSKIGHLSEQLGSLADAEQAYRDARSILERLSREEPTREEHLRNLALCCNNLGQVMQKQGAVTAAQQEMARALDIQQQLARRNSPASHVQSELAATHCNLGMLFNRKGEKRLAADHYQAAIEIQEAKRQAAPSDDDNRRALATSYNNLSALYLPARPAAAQQWVERALTLQIALVKEHPTQRDFQSDLALSYNNLGAIHSRQANWKAADLCFQDAITIQTRLVSVAPLVTAYHRDLAASFNNWGMSHTKAGSHAAAETAFGRALDIQQELVKQHPKDLRLLSSLGGIYNNLGILRQQSQQLERASEAFEQAIAAQRQAYERAPGVTSFRESLSKHYFNQAAVLRSLGRPDDAADAIIACRRLWPNDGRRLQRIADELAALCSEIPAGDARERLLNEATSTRNAAKAAGTNNKPAASPGRFEVLFESTITEASSPTPLPH